VVFGEPLGRHGDHALAEVIGILIANRSKRDFRVSRQNADCQAIKHPRILYQYTPESSIRASHLSHRRNWFRYCRTVIPRPSVAKLSATGEEPQPRKQARRIASS